LHHSLLKIRWSNLDWNNGYRWRTKDAGHNTTWFWFY
jgi:hypothetical protein